jgi:hypothetical protein
VFVPISAIFALLFFASTLPNGIRLVELPAGGDTAEIVAGYTTGGLTGLASTAAAKSLLLEAYAAGAKIDFIDELDRTALRITGPKWAVSMLAERLPAFFKEIPIGDKGDKGSDPSSPEFQAKVEEEIRGALLGSMSTIASSEYATGDAFVLISAPIPSSLRDGLAGIPKRGVSIKPDDQIDRLQAERTLRFKSTDLPTGAVIFASPISGVYYKQWYLVLLLDRVIHRVVPLPLKTSLPLTVRPYYYRLELTVPSGQFPEPAEENLLQELQRMQFTRADARDFMAAQQETLSYLDSSAVREWFASHDLSERRDEGAQWVQSMTADDMRVAVRDLLILNRVIVTWPPKPRQTSVSAESLSAVNRPAPSSPAKNAPRAEAVPQAEASQVKFPTHTEPSVLTTPAERLSSGVSLAASNVHAVFVSGGPFTRFDHEPTAADVAPFQKYRPERLLVLAPASSLDRARQLWASFTGSANGEIGVPNGNVSSGDLPALFILKTILDLKLIESGWWRDATLLIDAGGGSTLQIRAGDDKRAQILDWIKAIAAGSTPEGYLTWAREVAIHRFNIVQPHLQALTWEHDPQGAIQDLETITPKHIQDVARIYF